MPYTHRSNRKRRWTTFQLVVAWHKWFDTVNVWVVMVIVNECFFQSSIDEWIGDQKNNFKSQQKFKLAKVYCCRENSKFFIAVMFQNLTMNHWWMSIQFKIGTSVVHIVFFCFQITLVTDLQICLSNGFVLIKLA